MAEYRTRRCTRSGRRGRADQVAQQKAAAGGTRLSPVERETRGRSPPSGARASLRKVRIADRANFQLDRQRSLVNQDGQAGRQAARRTDCRLQRRKDRGMGGKTSEEEPQTSQNGNEKAAQPAASEQEAHLFHRLPGRPVRRPEIFKAEDGAETTAQSTKIAGRVERRRQGPCACGRTAAKRRANAVAIPRSKARKTAAEKSGQILSQIEYAAGIMTESEPEPLPTACRLAQKTDAGRRTARSALGE